ncbi:MAG TPA: type II toxin-antitoxin system VapC family toxin [Rubrivivax sp.]|nr:type II toxin-antitoxin system VapC family toxin [Rubrivivax sp.]
MTRAKASGQRVLYVAEPPPAWAAEPPAVVDASVLAAVLWAEPAAGEARRRMAGMALHAPTLIVYELANVARNKRRSGVPDEAARAGLLMLTEHKLALHCTAGEDLYDLACRHGLTAYDAAYLWLALTLRAPLLTFDQRLAEAVTRAQRR